MLNETNLLLGFAIYFIFATTVMVTLNKMLNGKRKPQVITLDIIMSMPTHDTFRLRSYDDCDEQESFQWCEYHYSRKCACLDTPVFIDTYDVYEIVLPIHERIEPPDWEDKYPFEWQMRINAKNGRKTKANK